MNKYITILSFSFILKYQYGLFLNVNYFVYVRDSEHLVYWTMLVFTLRSVFRYVT